MPLPTGHYWFPWLPDYGQQITDTPDALGSLADALTGAEERAVWLPAARRTLVYKLAPSDVATGVRMTDNLRAALVTGRASIPHWGRGRLLSAFAPGSAALSTALAHGMVPGTMAALYRPGDLRATLVEVYSVSSPTALTLTTPVPAGWEGTVWLAPVLHGRFDASASSWSALGDLRVPAVSFVEFPPPPVPVPAWVDFEKDFSYLWSGVAADFAVIRAVWSDGYDLDTRTAVIDSGTALDGVDVGWSRAGSSSLSGHTALQWAGDNTGNPGEEAILVDFAALRAALPAAATFKIRFRANWYGLPASGNFQLSIAGYIGGVMSQAGTDFINTGGTLAGTFTAPRHCSLHVSGDVDGQDMATITYEAASSLATVALA